MAGDEWEPEDDEPADDEGGEGGAGQGGTAPDKDGGQTLTEDEKAALAEIRKSGLKPQEVVARALKDPAVAGGPARNPPAAVPKDPNRVVTAAEVQAIYHQAREDALSTTARTELAGRIDDTVEADPDFAKVKPAKLRYLRDEVIGRLADKPEVMRLPRAQFLRAAAEITRQVLDEERGGTAGDADEAARRAGVAAETGESSRSAGGAVTKRAGASKNDGNGSAAEEFRFGVGPNLRYPTQEEIDAEYRKDLERFNTTMSKK